MNKCGIENSEFKCLHYYKSIIRKSLVNSVNF